MRFRIYYADRSTYSDTNGTPFDAPAFGVQWVTTMLPRWWGIYGQDYYWLDDDRWEGGNIGGLIDYLQRPGPRKVLWGRTIPDEDFIAIREWALHDAEYPQ